MEEQGFFMTRSIGSGLRVAQVLGLTSTAFFAGKAFSQSWSTTPALLQAPAPLLAKQWKIMFDSDKALGPAIVLFSSGVFGYLSYRERGLTTAPVLYATATAFLASCIPYSYFLLEPVTQKLQLKASSLASASMTDERTEEGVKRDETVHALVDRWATVNIGRAALTGISAFLAAWAAVDKMRVHGFQVVRGGKTLGR